MLTSLTPSYVVKPWGRCDLNDKYGAAACREPGPIGEIWFDRPDSHADDALLIKYLFTSERLSIQVHPDDQAARDKGLRRGKDEAWLVIEADESAEIGLGFNTGVRRADVIDALKENRLQELISWRRVAAGDVYYSPAGTVHALGGGLTVIEVQQNADVTYRLFDYGRDRELHVEEALAAMNIDSRPELVTPRNIAEHRELLVQSDKMSIERLGSGFSGKLDAADGAPLWIIPLMGTAQIDGKNASAPEVWIAQRPFEIDLPPAATAMIAYEQPALPKAN